MIKYMANKKAIKVSVKLGHGVELMPAFVGKEEIHEGQLRALDLRSDDLRGRWGI